MRTEYGKFVVGIDLDDTILNTSPIYNNYVKIYCEENNLLTDLIKTNSKIRNDFIEKYLKNIYENIPLKNNSKKVLDELIKTCEMCILTARSVDKYPIIEQITIDTLNKFNIPYSSIIFTSRTKVKECKDYKINLMVDDNIEVYNELMKNGINVLLFDENNNYPKIENKVKNWVDIYNYINEIMLKRED